MHSLVTVRTAGTIAGRAVPLYPNVSTVGGRIIKPRSRNLAVRASFDTTDSRSQINAMLTDRRKAISDSIRVVPHFPKQGIMFQDISTLLLDPIAFQYCIEDFVEHYRDQQIDAVAGVQLLASLT